MFGRSRSWGGGGGGGQGKAAKNIHSLEHLKYMYHVLTKNTTVTDHNRNLLVETIRSITEILIWGDQNDSSVFDFFLEKNMFVYFLNILRQKSGRYVCVQLLQTLNILFENISHETSLYYLLSNNYVNSIIVHKFDFSDEEIMAYYISFLKTLSLKLNNHTVHFFYNEHTNDFALYTEAIKFFNHPESMVRIAVRTITLNVYKVDNQPMLHYIRDKTAVPYFSNLVWFIGSHVIELDNCVKTDEEHRNRGKLSDLVAEHLDHLHYLNDILIINCEFLNDVLTDHLLNSLFLPLYVYSLVNQDKAEERPKISLQVSLYLLSQVFLIIHYAPLVNSLAEVILNGDLSRFFSKVEQDIQKSSLKLGPLEIEMVIMERCKLISVTEQNITDEEKSAAASGMSNWNRPFLEMVYNALECAEFDYYALFVLCLLYAMSHNKGIQPVTLERIQLSAEGAEEKNTYNPVLAERIIRIMNFAAQPDGKIRLATLELGCILLKQLVMTKARSIIKDIHLACLEGAREESVHLVRRFYKGEEIFLDMFEDEYRSMTLKPMNVEYLMMDASILLPPTGTPLTGIDFVKRLPCGDVERTRRAIRVFFMLRSLSLHLQDEPETQLPLTREEDLIKTDDVLDLNNSDLIACTVITKDGGPAQRFLAVDIYQMSLVEPDVARLGWGVVKFAGLLQDMQVTGVEDDSRALNIVIHKPASSPHSKPFPILQATFIFSDHIRCIIAKQRLAKGRIQARRMKMQRIAALLDLPVQPANEVMGFSHGSASAAQHLPFRFYDQARRGACDQAVQRSVFASVDKVPGFAVAQCRPSLTPSPSPSPSPSSSGSTGRCDSAAASSSSTPSAVQSPADDSAAPDQTPTTTASSSSSVRLSGTDDPSVHVSKSASKAAAEGESTATTTHLSPCLTPAPQPSISLLSAEALSVESLTLVPPVAPGSILAVSALLRAPDSEANLGPETPGDGALSDIASEAGEEP
nr:protein CLEC16A [Anolis sagrei ordinatus]